MIDINPINIVTIGIIALIFVWVSRIAIVKLKIGMPAAA